MFVRDIDGNEFVAMATTTVQETINGDRSIAVDFLPNKANALFMEDIDKLWRIVTDEGVEYTIINLSNQGKGHLSTKKVTAIPSLFDKLRTTREYDPFTGSTSFEALLTLVFRDTGYTYNLIGSWNNIQIENFGNGDDKLTMFNQVLNRYGAEFTFTGTNVTVMQKIGIDTQHMYAQRLNASNIVQQVDAENFYTYARGFGDFDEGDEGNAKLKRTYTSPLMALLGKREAPPIRDGRIKVASTMDASLKKLVDESIKISISADLVDLRMRNYPYAQSNLGDRVFIIDERIGLKEEVRIVSRTITRNWKDEIIGIKFVFGTEGLTKRYTAKINGGANTIKDLMDGTKKLPFNAMASELIISKEIMDRMLTQLVIDDNGNLVAIDPNNPNLYVAYGSRGLFVSEDGGATVKTAITGRGIVGQLIIAESILADALASNTITVGFNRNSTNIKLYGNRIDFLDNAVLTGRVTERGQEFWHGTRFIGYIGENALVGNPAVRGIGVYLDDEGDYMSFSASSGGSNYITQLTVDPYGRFTGYPGIVLGTTLQARGNRIQDISRVKPLGTPTGNIRYGYKDIAGTQLPMIGDESLQNGIIFGNGTLYLMQGNTYWPLSDLIN